MPGNISHSYFHSREEEQDVPIEEPPRGTRGRSERVTGSYALGVEMIELVFAVCMVATMLKVSIAA